MPKLRLKVTHTHAGVAYPPGHVIDVDEHTARWLIDRQIGEPEIATPAKHDALPTPDAPAARPPRTHQASQTPKE